MELPDQSGQVDPSRENYLYASPYVGMGNNPISMTDPDGRNVIVGGFFERAINKVFGYKTESLAFAEKAVATYRSTESGAKFLSQFEGEGKPDLRVATGTLQYGTAGKCDLAVDAETNTVKGAKIILDQSNIEEASANGYTSESTGENAFSDPSKEAAVTIGHESGHIDYGMKNPAEFQKDKEVPYGQKYDHKKVDDKQGATKAEKQTIKELKDDEKK